MYLRFFLFFSYALSDWQVSDCDRYLSDNVSKFYLEDFKIPFIITQMKMFSLI